ncbi:kelch-like protein 5 [Vespula pensylvanica]|uniref:kelch-like protein 5 n=1 Tax=Vespula pensylvanica TaxID=30213 RepID=UPI001CBA3831|nr:kelch-like protein 5 [Vespula pensylvanica]XP_043679057.1 kelch-like protein 5 [Vespula pensylvanica]
MSKIFAAMMNTSETEPEFSFVDKEASASEHSFSSIVGIVPKHAESSLRIMEEYLDKQQLTDVVLIAGNKRIPAHRLVLSAGSEYFAAMFTGFLRESKENEIELVEVDGDALCSLVRYCYTGCIELKEDSVQTLLATAHLLQLHPVVKACCRFLRKQLHPSNCLGIRMFADMQGCIGLLKQAHAYTTEHFMEVIKNQEFLLCSADQVAELLESNDLNVPSEDTIFHALTAWLKYDPANRKKDASRLLSLVKLPLLSPAFIADHIESNEMFKDQKAAQELIIEALKYHLLPERRPLLQSNRTKPRKATVGELLAVGGMDANEGPTLSIYSFSLRENSWKSVATMWGKRLQFGAAVVDRKLIIAGGRDGLKTLNTVECFDFSTRNWSTLPSMIVHRHGLGVAVLGGPLYAVGGHDGWSFLDTVERWDPDTKQWRSISPMSIQRSTVGVAVLNDKLYAVGGRDISSCLNTVECYDPHTNKWTACAPMSKQRGGVGVGVVNGCLYALGGHEAPASNPNASRFDCVERYDPKTDTWTMVAPMSVARDAVGVCVLGDKLMAVGGYDGQQYLTLVEAYDPHLNKWEPVTPLLTGRGGPCVVIENSLRDV